MSLPVERARAVKEEARRLGFDAVGVAAAGPADPEGHLAAWLARGLDGGLRYLADTALDRADVRRYVPNARSVVALSTSYFVEGTEPEGPRFARFARGTDYHNVLRRRLRTLRKFLLRLDPGARVAPSVDFTPVLERAWAARAGVAWIGKSTMALSQELGTYTFLSTLITTTELAADAPVADRCGSCTACLDACPTQAFVAPYVLDAGRCISTHTIELRGEPAPGAPPSHGWLGGCDVCQEVCPWNKFARPTRERRFAPRPELASPELARLASEASDPALERAIDESPLSRIGREGVRRNALRVIAERDLRGPAPPPVAGEEP